MNFEKSELFLFEQKKTNLGFYLILVLIFFDYVRPQNELAFLKILRIPMILIVVITFITIKNKLWTLNDRTTKAFLILIIIGAAYVPFAKNNFWAFETTRTLFISFPSNGIRRDSVCTVSP